MRLLLWVLLATLIALFASTEATPSTIVDVKTSKAAALENEPTINTGTEGARRLRRSAEKIADDGNDSVNEDERDLASELAVAIRNVLGSRLARIQSNSFWNMYRLGETPTTM
ncbi:unnamed protein product [Phytophthora lilii]|uniref:RxLR effector protein n=1 Tax=Phytophthora lilii TaxID=2077276 RepID=A0A9W6TFY3_9STRA|nr:unnamed protein product [Phytophthora lilii]